MRYETSNEQSELTVSLVRCLLWGSDQGFRNYYYLIRYYELSGMMTVIGITSNNPIHSEICGYRLIQKEDIDKESFDRVIIMSFSDTVINEIKEEAYSHGINEIDIVPCSVMRLPGFDFYKYRQIKSNPPTIFAPNCWGGVTYNRLRLRFDSPLINMFEDLDDYIRFLTDPKAYIDADLGFHEMFFDGKKSYPVGKCCDILLYFNHYLTFDEAYECWERRKKRIKWDNLFVMMYNDDPDRTDRVDRFCELPYENKICFVPYNTDKKDVVSIEYSINDRTKGIPFGDIVNGMATGKWMYYNVFDLILYNKITPIAHYNQNE